MFDRKKYMEQYRNNHKSKIKKQRKLYYENNKKKENEQSKEWRENNPERFKELRNQWQNNKRKKDSKFNLKMRITLAIYKALKGNKNGRHWEYLVGYTLSDLKRHLKKTMPEGYTWQDFLQGKLQIDHRIPISAFNFDCPEHIDFKRCWALKNLRLLPSKENISKGNKLTKPFQLALRI